jgi:hypothetical protein
MTRVSEPLYRTATAWSETHGDVAAEVGADLGLAPDVEQRWLLDAIFAEKDDAVPVHDEVCIVGPRQTVGKTATLQIAALTDLFVLEVELAVWTAHEAKTARKTFQDMRRRIMANPDYEARARFETAIGREAIVLDTGERLEFHARSGSSGRGFTCQKLTLDEWLFGQPGDVGALAPTLVTIPDAQTRYASSAGKAISGALRDLRRRGRAGDVGLAYAEYGAPRRDCELGNRCPHTPMDEIPGCALDDRELWWHASSALWSGRIGLGAIEKQRRKLPPVEFMREFLSWWEDPPNIAGGDLDTARWGELHDTAAQPRKPLVVGVDQGEDRTVSIGVAWRRADGHVQVMLAHEKDAPRPDVGLSPAAAVLRLAQLRKTWGARVLLGGPALGLERELLDAGVPVEVVSGSEFATACGQLDDRIRAGTVHHGAQSELTDSVGVARWRAVGTAGERAFQLRGVPGVGPAAAVVRALHGVLSRPATTSGPVAITTSSAASDVASMQF